MSLSLKLRLAMTDSPRWGLQGSHLLDRPLLSLEFYSVAEGNIMTQRTFIYIIAAIGLAFTIAFAILVMPSLLKDLSIVTALSAGFANPYSTGFSLDTLSSWLVLTMWIIYEARSSGIKHGWIAILLGLIPGTATGFAVYLILRTMQAGKASAA